EERGRLTALAAERGFALVSDEVFLDYRFAPAASDVRVGASEPGGALVFSLGGLSKTSALPQLKLGWVLAGGPEPLLSEALHRLEWIADAFLSVSTPVQLALQGLLARAPRAAAAVTDRVLRNEALLREAFRPSGAVSVLPVPAGWAAVLRVPALVPEEELVLSLLSEEDLLVHPGYFFEFPHEAFLVLSLLPETGELAEGVARLARRLLEGAP
ncbi:MAG: aminotransferase class I/II-fold pyridoxal phosphate-dependent enzyme, partial [Acidobacteria bacterium ACB2]|nr:aminotransferase class I/II-fold pyridoxal phosphate-dependent enzyme [Acidobacteria bacterium ACB2]